MTKRALFAKSIALGMFSLLAHAMPTRAAERIYFDYSVFSWRLPVADLEAYAKDGTITPELNNYLKLIPPQSHDEFRKVLVTPLPKLQPKVPQRLFSPFVVSQWLYAPMGKKVLTGTGQIIQAQSNQNGWQSLRSAMILAAAQPEGPSVINVIKAFPTKELRFNLAKALLLSKFIQTNTNRTKELVNTVRTRSLERRNREPKIDYNALPVLADTPKFSVKKQSLQLNDTSRNRTFPVDLYQPANLNAVKGSLPVLVFSHGYGDSRTNGTWTTMAKHLAGNGFLVALPEHIGSNQRYRQDFTRGLHRDTFQVMEFVNRPQDIRFLLDQLEVQNQEKFQGRLQLDRVGLLGHSFGGYTALATAGATVDVPRLKQTCTLTEDTPPSDINLALLLECRLLELSDDQVKPIVDGSLADDRIKLVMAMAPVSKLFGPSGIGKLQMPVVIMGGAYDIAAPIVPEQMETFTWLKTPKKYFYLAENTSHTAELSRLVLGLVHPGSGAAQSFQDSRQWLHSIVDTLLIAQSRVHLLQEKEFNPYLTSAYVEAVSINPAKIHLVRSLP